MAEHGKLNVLQIQKVYWSSSEACNSCGKAEAPLARAPQRMWRFSVGIGPRPAGTVLQKVPYSPLGMKRGRKVPKCSCHTSLDMPQRSKWSSPLYLPCAIFYQGKLWFLSIPSFGFMNPNSHRYPERFQTCRYSCTIRHLIPSSRTHSLKESFPMHFGSRACWTPPKRCSNSRGSGEEMGGPGSNGKPSGYQSAPWNHQGWNPYFPHWVKHDLTMPMNFQRTDRQITACVC